MRKFSTTTLLFIVLIIKTIGQIPNNSFENWNSFGAYEEPNDWATTNFTSTGTFYPATKSTDHYPEGLGSYSLRVENNISLLPNYVGAGGVISAPFGSPHPAFPLRCTPDYMSGYYKFYPINGDTLHIRLTLFNLGTPVAFLDFNTTEAQTTWKYFTLAIPNNIDADSGHIVFASYNAIGSIDKYKPYGNSVAFFDNFNFNKIISSSTITKSVCGSYTAPDGAVYTTSGIKTAVIPNSKGCDSTITINLTIKNSTSSTITRSACGSYTAPDGVVYTTSGIKTAIIPNSKGCDSTITINLTIKNSTSSTITKSACGSYTAPDGVVYTTSGIKTAVIPNSKGCDSTITINLTIKNSTSSTITKSACGSYTAPDGVVYTTSGIKTVVIPNSKGCDSTITINLTIKNSTSSTITRSACGSYTAPDGVVYTTSGIKTAVIPNSKGCDSTITINLTITNLDISVNLISNILTSNAFQTDYQWIDCNNSAPLSGQTNQSLSPPYNGSFAVIISQNGCIDTSSCYDIIITKVIDNNFDNSICVYPNPTLGELSIDLGFVFHEIIVLINENNGRLISLMKYKDAQLLNSYINGSSGLYSITILADNENATFRVIKN